MALKRLSDVALRLGVSVRQYVISSAIVWFILFLSFNYGTLFGMRRALVKNIMFHLSSKETPSKKKGRIRKDSAFIFSIQTNRGRIGASQRFGDFKLLCSSSGQQSSFCLQSWEEKNNQIFARLNENIITYLLVKRKRSKRLLNEFEQSLFCTHNW